MATNFFIDEVKIIGANSIEYLEKKINSYLESNEYRKSPFRTRDIKISSYSGKDSDTFTYMALISLTADEAGD